MYMVEDPHIGTGWGGGKEPALILCLALPSSDQIIKNCQLIMLSWPYSKYASLNF